MGKRESEKINNLVGTEIIDQRFNLKLDNLEEFISKSQLLLEKPTQQNSNNLKNFLSALITIAWEKGIFPSSLQQINKMQVSKEPFSSYSIPVLDVSDFGFEEYQHLFELMATKHKFINSFGFDFSQLNSIELLLQIARMFSAALIYGYEGPLFLQANQIHFEPFAFEHDREELLEKLKKKTHNAIQLGIYNINYDASELIDNKSRNISEKMLMNLKMVAMATNLWVRSFQPSTITVSVSGKMGLVDGRIPYESEFKEYLQRLLKEGSRLRFGVAGEDISKVEVVISEMNELNIEKTNRLNAIGRQDYKLGGVVVNVGEIKNIDFLSFIQKLKVCEVKMKIPKALINVENMQSLFDVFDIEKMQFDLKTNAARAHQMPTLEGIL